MAAQKEDGGDETNRLLAKVGVHDPVERDRMFAEILMSREGGDAPIEA